ncbi:MAG TPA: aspartate kinase, partial [Thermomicrobiales bacterium]|nr:aspartate kinase [Thermomicrobiales bacterium]
RRNEMVAHIRARHTQILEGISIEDAHASARAAIDALHIALDESLDEIAADGELTDRLSDRVVATGEKCMSVLMSATIRELGGASAPVFADTVIATDERHGSARPDRALTRERADSVIRPLLDAGNTVVATGFIGAGPDGATTTLGRGGSDYSATLLGAALDADEVQIWTDVPGVLSADPRKVARARVVPEISYDEAQELAHFGAKVLHPRTIRPAVALNIPVHILSTFAPDEPGTIVTQESSGNHVKAVTALKGLILLTLDVPELEDLAPAASATFRILDEQHIEIVTVSQASSRRRMTFLVDAVLGGCARLQTRIEEQLGDHEVTVTCSEDVAAVAAVGAGAAGTPSALSAMLTALHRANVPVLATNQQTSNVAMLVVIPEEDADRAVAALHDRLIRPQLASNRDRRRRRSDLMAESFRVG